MPTGMQSLDLGQPTINEGQSLEDKLQLILNYNLELMQSLRYILSNLGRENLNDKEFEDMTAPVFRQIEDVEGNLLEVALVAGQASVTASDALGKATTAKLTADGASITASNAFGKAQQMEFTVDGLTVRNPDGSTTIDGDKIKSGTIEGVTLQGVTLISQSGYGDLRIANGGLSLTDGWPSTTYFSLYRDYFDRIWLEAPASSLKINCNTDMSVDAGNGSTLYLGASSYGGDVKIGVAGSTVRIEGDLIINGVPYVPAGGGE